VRPVSWTLTCVACGADHDGRDPRMTCDCGGTLDVVHDLQAVARAASLATWDARRGSLERLDRSGVWRFRELVLPGVDPEAVATKPEGNTNLYDVPARLAHWAGLDALQLKHEGENPSGSFKDRGMTTGVTAARLHGATKVACASTGNTSASMAAYAALAGLEPYVFVPAGKIAYGKLSQALAFGAKTLQLDGDFDEALALVREICRDHGVYLLNSVNPYRLEGQKAIGFEILSDLGWRVPDWLVLPGGNLGNSSAISKGLMELLELGWIDRLPRMAVIQAAGANPLYRAWVSGQDVEPVTAETIATAIRIGNPVSWRKSLRGVRASGGLVEQVSDAEILDAKSQVDAAGIGAEPASCATVAGIHKLVAAGTIRPADHVVGVLTGHLLKDPDVVVSYHRSDAAHANPPVPCAATVPAVLEALGLS